MKERLKEMRKRLNLTQAELAQRVGLSASAISMMERGVRTPPESTMRLICQTFNVSYSWLSAGQGDMMDAAEDAFDAITGMISALKQMPDNVWAAFKEGALALLDSVEASRAAP